jgi:hypothetical protein
MVMVHSTILPELWLGTPTFQPFQCPENEKGDTYTNGQFQRHDFYIHGSTSFSRGRQAEGIIQHGRSQTGNFPSGRSF